FIDAAHDDQFDLIPDFSGQTQGFITLKNPILEEAVRMRPTLLPGLLEALRHNLNHGVRDVRLFESGRVFAEAAAGELPIEREAVAFIATGGAAEADRAQALREIDFYDLKGALEAAVTDMNLASLRFAKSQARHLRQGQAADIVLHDGTAVGSLGRLADSVADSYKFRQPVYVGELDLTKLLAAAVQVVQYKPLPRFPSVVRDVTILLDRHVPLEELLRAVAAEKVEDCRDASLVGTYEGSNIPEGKRTVTLRIEYRSDERTLRDEEVEERQRRLIDTLLQKYSAQLH
ncbi:MAG: hypothetical protein ABJB97_03290, partial [Acidobacteriota bacterium]